MDQSLLLIEIAGETAAIGTDSIQSVVELEAVTVLPCVPPHVAGLAPLRSHTMTVIDCTVSLGLKPSSESACELECAFAVVIELNGFLYALVVDSVADVIACDAQPAPLRTKLGSGWTRAALGMVQTPEGPALLLDPAQIIAGPAQALAA